MDWKSVLSNAMEREYASAERLIGRLADTDLGYKPATENNWMTAGQLIWHVGDSCGVLVVGFVTGHWPVPEGFDPDNIKPEDMLLPAEAMTTAPSVAAALERLAADRAAAFEALAGCAAERADEPAPAAWDPSPMPLFERLLTAVQHLTLHKAQLYYYLKLMGQPVNTMDLW